MNLEKGHTAFHSGIGFRCLKKLLLIAIVMLVGMVGMGQSLYVKNTFAISTCNPNARRISDAVCLQDMNGYVVQTMTPDVEYRLKDKRTDEEYRVALMKDGNVWLLDNLIIGGEVEMLLTSEDTNTDPNLDGGNFVLPASGSEGNSYTTPMIYTGVAYQPASDENDWRVGGYYNYCAASAGTYCDESNEAEGDAEYDICPAGWRMPTGGSDGEYQAAVSRYDDQIAAFHLPLSGRYYDGSTGYIGEEGYFWSSTNRDGRRMYYLNRSGDSLSPTGSYRRDRGYSMRCVAKVEKPAVSCNSAARNIDEAVCMQDMNAMVKDSMEEDVEYSLVDSRDQEEYKVAKLKDGNVWLLDNLRLGKKNENMTLTLDDTNTNPEKDGGVFTLYSGDYWEDSYTEMMINVDDKNKVSDSQDGWKTGGYYNYCAASAGTYCEQNGEGNAEYDICPAKWRMPTGGEGGEYANVAGYYDDIQNTLRLPLSGRYYGGQAGRKDYGYFWSSVSRDETRMMGLYRSNSGVETVFHLERDRGYSMRCVVNIKEEGEGGSRWKNGVNRHMKGTDGDLTFLIDLSPEAVVSVKVDGAELDSSNYEVLNENGTAILLKRDYINNLEPKTYQLTVRYESDNEFETEFIIESPEEDIVVPNTGGVNREMEYSKADGMVIGLIIGGLSGIVFGTVAIRRLWKKKHFRVDFS